MKVTNVVPAIALSFVLSACSTSQESVNDPLSGLYKVVAQTNSVKTSDFYFNKTLFPLEGCSQIQCTARNFLISLTTPVNTLVNSDHATEAEIGGVDIVRGGNPDNWTLFGGWMTHSAFFVHRFIGQDDAELVVSQSLGRLHLEDSAVLPVEGSASYRGAMVGTNIMTSDPYTGQSSMTANFGEIPTINIHFTNVMNLRTGDYYRDISYTGASISERKGIWSTSLDGGSVNGEFMGPNNEEVVGVFDYGDLIGAFGAQRVD